jgi:hypothetical protein
VHGVCGRVVCVHPPRAPEGTVAQVALRGPWPLQASLLRAPLTCLGHLHCGAFTCLDHGPHHPVALATLASPRVLASRGVSLGVSLGVSGVASSASLSKTSSCHSPQC